MFLNAKSFISDMFSRENTITENSRFS